MATYNFTVRAKDESGAFSDRDFSIQIKNNLIDRMIAINTTDLYASVDGVNFTLRKGKGGVFSMCALDRWVVFTDSSTYRISSDSINWHEDNKLRVLYKNGAVESEVIAVLYSNVNTFEKSYFEYDGWLYMAVTVSSIQTLIRSRNLVNWECIYSDDKLINIPQNRGGFLVDNNTLLFTSSSKVYSVDLVENVVEVIVEKSLPFANYSDNNTFMKVNGVYMIIYSSSTLSHIASSVDLENWNISYNTGLSFTTQSISKYINGRIFILPVSSTQQAGIIKSPVSIELSSNYASVYGNVYDVFNGKLYGLQGGVLRATNDLVSLNRSASLTGLGASLVYFSVLK